MITQAAARPYVDPASRELADALPLYAASLMVTLAGVGAVGVTYTSGGWAPVWGFLAILGHAVSLLLRRMRVPAESIFYPIMVLGAAVALQLTLVGSPLVGLQMGLGQMPADMGTSLIIACLAVVRSFTLLSNSALLFSPVPAITMLALVATANPNPEVPLFFGLLLLGSLFITGYEAHLRRMNHARRPAEPVLFHLLASWSVTLAVALAALSFPFVVQPVIGPLSPFALPGVTRFRSMVNNFTQNNGQQAPVGQGPIRLSPAPVYEVYMPEGGLLRTDVYNSYTGRGWRLEEPPMIAGQTSDRQVDLAEGPGSGEIRRRAWEFQFPPDPNRSKKVPERRFRQRVVTVGYGFQGVPALGRIESVLYPTRSANLHASGCVSGNGHQSIGRVTDVVSLIAEPPPELLRQAPPVDPETFLDTDTLSLPQSTLPVQTLAKEITQSSATPYDRVQAILGYIEENCRYTLLEPPTPAGEDAAAHYLLRTRRGACDLAATAAAVMCRSAGVPARIAVGYVAEEPLESGDGFMVRQEHAHMWFEAFFPGYGWVAFNPSPPLAAIRENPLDVLWSSITGIFGKIGGGGLDSFLLLIVVLITVAAVGYRGFLRIRAYAVSRVRAREIMTGPPAGAIALVYAEAARSLERRGWRREGWMTPREFARALEAEWMGSIEGWKSLAALTELFQRAHYAGQATAEDRDAAVRLAADLLQRAPRRRLPSTEGAVTTSAAASTA